MLKRNLIIILASAAIIALALYYTLNQRMKPVSKAIDSANYLAVTNEFLDILEKRWLWGDIEGFYEKEQLNCPELIKYNPAVYKNYLVCNPAYIRCFLKQGLVIGEYQLNFKKMISSSPVKIKLEILKLGEKFYEFDLNLMRKCHEVELPTREYLLESLGEKKWSHFGRKIYIDKFLVTQNDINMWKNDYKTQPIYWGLPALGLKVEEQHQYCQSRGKKLMKAHLFEAATRLQPSQKLSPYPWSHYSQTSSEGLVNVKAGDDICRKAYMKECKDKVKWRSFDTDSVSWVGLHDVFGGPPERFINIHEPEKQFKKADWSTSFRDKNARIGFKAKAVEAEAGFRCYREEI